MNDLDIYLGMGLEFDLVDDLVDDFDVDLDVDLVNYLDVDLVDDLVDNDLDVDFDIDLVDDLVLVFDIHVAVVFDHFLLYSLISRYRVDSYFQLVLRFAAETAASLDFPFHRYK